MIRVMVAEDNISLNSIYCSFLNEESDIDIVAKTFDGETTLKEYLEYKPDVLLLDLNMPKLNGIEIINYLSENIEEKHKCNVIIISGSNKLSSKLYNTSKLYRIFIKPFSTTELIKTIKEIVPVESNKTIECNKINDLFIKLKMNPYSKGYIYMRDALNIIYSDPSYLYNMKDLYNEIAQKYNLCPKKIQWSIRNSIDALNRYASKEILHSFFHIYGNETITPKYFFSIVTEYFINNNF